MQPGGYPAPSAIRSSELRPSRGWYVVAGLLVVVGAVGAILFGVFGFGSLADKIDDFDRIPSSSAQQFTIDDPGEYSVYYEFPGAADGAAQPFLELTLSGPTGDDVTLSRSGSSVSYDFSGHEGVRVFTFDADQAGRYLLDAQGPRGSTIAVGEGVGNDIVWTIVGALLIGLGGFLSGAVIGTVTAVRRYRARKRLQPPPFAGPPPPWIAPPGYPPPGYAPPGQYPPLPG